MRFLYTNAMPELKYHTNPLAEQDPNAYGVNHFPVEKLVASWRGSLAALNWLDKDGRPIPPENLEEKYLERYKLVAKLYGHNKSMARPVIGIGIFDSIEFGSAAEVFYLALMEGKPRIEAHYRVNQEKDLKNYFL